MSPGGNTSATGSIQVKDTKTGTIIICHTVRKVIVWKTGTGLPGQQIARITVVTLISCIVATITVTVTAEDLPWHLNAISYNGSTGVTTGTVTGVELAASAPGCTATVEGTTATNGKIKVTYTNSTGVLKLLPTGGNLSAEDVSGCFGLINNGDPLAPSGSFTVTPKQTVTGA